MLSMKLVAILATVLVVPGVAGGQSVETGFLDRTLRSGDEARRYQHIHVMPNHLVSLSGIYAEFVTVVPLGPERCRREGWGFVPRGVRANPLARGLDVAHRALTRRGADALLREDGGVWPAVQAGIRHSRYRGVLSAREERVAHFQQWVARRIRAAAP